jgi:hypothetical protein
MATKMIHPSQMETIKPEAIAIRMLKKMNKQIPNQDQESGILASQPNTLRKNFHDRRRQHETSAQGNKVLEVRPLPVFLDDDCATKEICCRSG